MADPRELILDRLVEIGAGIEGIVTAKRNIKRPPDELLDAIVVLDADETADQGDPSGRQSHSYRRVGMTPEIYILAKGKPEEVGTRVNLLRARFVKAVLTDSELIALLGSNGEMRYEGCATALSWGREMIGDMGVSFTFHYVLRPELLA